MISPTTATADAKRCPFASNSGYATADTRQDWLKHKGIIADESMLSLEADSDTSKPLYFWQIYSLIGHRPILHIVRDFYLRVFDDSDDPEFRITFTRLGGVEYHIQRQAAYWIDSMGGGRFYHGGNHRILFHHTYNAEKVMNATGAARWMFHMRGAINAFDFSRFQDARIKPCIVDFLKVRMMKYAFEHDWIFDESDFLLEGNVEVPLGQPTSRAT